MTMKLPAPRPSEHIANPTLYGVARRRWPGTIVTAASLFDAAVLSSLPHHIPATREAAALLRTEIAVQHSIDVQGSVVRHQYRRMGFDPTKNYLAKD